MISRLRIFFVFCILVACLNACSYNEEAQVDSKLVVATTGMIADALRHILPPEIEVHALMGPGVDPHLYEPLPSDVRALAKAKFVVYNGLHLEGKMTEVLHKLERYKLVHAWSEGLSEESLIRVSEDYFDPHIWLDPFIWAEGLYALKNKTKKAFPQYREFIEESFMSYKKEILKEAHRMNGLLSVIPQNQRTLITSHDAFSYFGKAFDVRVMALQGISTVGETGLRKVESLADFIVKNEIKSVFIESSVSTKSVTALQESCERKSYTLQRGGVLYSDALGDAKSGADTYLGMLRKNTSTIVNGLK